MISVNWVLVNPSIIIICTCLHKRFNILKSPPYCSGEFLSLDRIGTRTDGGQIPSSLRQHLNRRLLHFPRHTIRPHCQKGCQGPNARTLCRYVHTEVRPHLHTSLMIYRAAPGNRRVYEPIPHESMRSVDASARYGGGLPRLGAVYEPRPNSHWADRGCGRDICGVDQQFR